MSPPQALYEWYGDRMLDIIRNVDDGTIKTFDEVRMAFTGIAFGMIAAGFTAETYYQMRYEVLNSAPLRVQAMLIMLQTGVN
jgi:hypothetical protein